MGKKSKRNRSNRSAASTQQDQGEEDRRLAPAVRSKTQLEEEEEETRENLRFQDPFIEEYVPDDGDNEDWEDEEDEENNNKASEGVEDGGTTTEMIQSWNPLTGKPLEPGEKLEMDPSAYKMHHDFTATWPALSFDFIRDDLGECRTRFPHSMIMAVGSQADRPEHNELTIIRLSDLTRIPVETEDDILGDELDHGDQNNDKIDDDDDDSSSEEDDDRDPIMEHFSIKHYGGVNRVRCMPQDPSVVATWSDSGRVNLFNVDPILQRFAISVGKMASLSSSSTSNALGILQDIPTKPFFSYSKHKSEGYALDWSPLRRGLLATGDCNGNIHLWQPRPEGGYHVTPSYTSTTNTTTAMSNGSGTASVEDIQWSPSEETVFATGECGGYVRIFDTRATGRAMLSHRIHPNGADINVLSWNKLVHNLLATGSDDGILSVWDLRQFTSTSSTSTSSSTLDKVSPLARFTPHKTPITSLQWHPTDESMLAVTDDVGAYIYDLSVEEDDNNHTTSMTNAMVTDTNAVIPPQLLFVHCGHEQFKEIRWHPQISSCLMTTALSGFGVFIPSNL